MLESKHERRFCDHVEESGGVTLKVKLRGYPDRLVITHTGYLYWLEAKRPEGSLGKYQVYIHKILRELNQDVRTAYDYEEAIEQYEEACST